MNAQVLALANQKGGIDKSTSYGSGKDELYLDDVRELAIMLIYLPRKKSFVWLSLLIS